MNKHSPTPWRVRPHLPDAHFETIADANDATVGTVTLFENARMIVESVNTMAAFREAGDKLGRYYTPKAILANPPWKSGEVEAFTLKSHEQLRDLLRRVAHCLKHRHLAGDIENALLREVRETLGGEP